MTSTINNVGIGITKLASAATPTHLLDKTDSPHSGLFKALHRGMEGNYAVKASSSDALDIQITLSGTQFRAAVTTAGKGFFNGKLITINTLSATNIDKPTAGAYYHWVRYASNGAVTILNGDTDGVVPDLGLGYAPIALIKVQSTDTATSDIAIQYFTTFKDTNTLSVAYADSSTYTETLSIASSAGDTNITSNVSDKDIIFSVNDGGASKEMLRLDADEPTIKIEQGSLKIKETAAAIADTPAYGQLWVKSDSPTSLYFTTDAGDDIQLTSGTAIVGNVNLNSVSAGVIADGDSIVFIDADDSNVSKKETLSDFLDVVAGTVATTGLDRSGATLVVSDLHPVGVDGSANQLLTDDGDGTVTSESKLTFDGSTLTVDTDFTGTTTATTKGAHIDFDATGITASGQTATNIGLDLDLNSDSPTMVGTVNNTGIDVDLTGGTSGAQTNVGINVAVTGADTNYAALFSGGNVGIGEATPDTMLHLSSGSDQAPQITLENTGTDEAAPNEPEIIFKRNSTPSAEGDHDSFDIGTIKYNARDHAGTTHTFGQMLCDIFDDSDGSEDGRFLFYHLYNGTNVQAFNMGGGQVVINDGGVDINFRCETTGDANALFVDAGQDKVGIGLNSPKTKLTVEGALTLKEQADADGDTAAYGQLWVHDDTPNTLYFTNDAGNDIKLSEEVLIVSLSDETTDLTTGTAKASFNMPFAMTLTGVKATVNTAPVGSTIIVDINEAGSTVLTTKLSIDASELTSTSAASAAVIGGAGPALADDALITFDIDQIGSSTAGKGLKVTLYGYRT